MIVKLNELFVKSILGKGKSFLAQALARRAITLGYSAKYYRVSNFFQEIKMARLDGSYTKTITKIAKFKLLILDDFGVTPLKSN